VSLTYANVAVSEVSLKSRVQGVSIQLIAMSVRACSRTCVTMTPDVGEAYLDVGEEKLPCLAPLRHSSIC
jgi:hypothetical protein